MKPFNEATPCQKCGATDAATEYQDLSNVCGVKVLAKMRRTCRRCSYNWYELPLDAPDLGVYFSGKARHIESRDSNAICLCGSELVYRGSGLFVCPNAEKKEGAVPLLGSYVRMPVGGDAKWETSCGCKWLVDPIKDMDAAGYPKQEVFARRPDFPCQNHKKAG